MIPARLSRVLFIHSVRFVWEDELMLDPIFNKESFDVGAQSLRYQLICSIWFVTHRIEESYMLFSHGLEYFKIFQSLILSLHGELSNPV